MAKTWREIFGFDKELEEAEQRGEQRAEQRVKQQTTVAAIKNVMEAFGVTVEKAMDSLKVPQSQRETYAELVNS